jgi:colanic acid/amylovoran biosynthesis protein
MNILVVNLHAMSNRGDAAIAHVTLRYLHQAFPNARITLAANHPNEFVDLADAVVPSFKTWVWSTNRQNRAAWHPLRFMWFTLAALSLCYWRLWKRLPRGWPAAKHDLLRAYAQADLIVGCGGNTLYARRRLAVMFWIVCFGQWCTFLCHKPLVLLPQTIGPFRNCAHMWGARQALKHAQLVLLRDHESYRLALETLKLPAQRCAITADLALFLADQDGTQFVAPERSPLIGVSVLDWGAQMASFAKQAAYEHAVADAITQLADLGYRVAFFAQSDTSTWGENDAVPAQRIVERLDTRTRAAVDGVLRVPHQPDQMVRFYGQFRLVIATRLHAMILSVAAGTPVVPIAYTSKNWAFVHNTELEPLTLDIATVTADEIVAASSTVLNDYACWQQRIVALVEQKRAQADVVNMLKAAVRAN